LRINDETGGFLKSVNGHEWPAFVHLGEQQSGSFVLDESGEYLRPEDEQQGFQCTKEQQSAMSSKMECGWLECGWLEEGQCSVRLSR
jgi:hypothetical protein